jgi:phenylalanyl-tRNA synthetase beta chain
MNISLNWLSQHLDLAGKSPEELDRLLTFAGVEVEAIEVRGIPSDQIVVAEVVEAEPHPDADRLKVTRVDAGEGALRQIVCGATNYRVGDKVPCCLPGADLGGFEIGVTKMRGVESRGMLAAASEIGLTDAEDGLMILPSDAEIGRPLSAMFEADVRLEVEVTPNRPDLLSHFGMARELGALLEQPVNPPELGEFADAGSAGVRLEAAEACPHYTAIEIHGLTVKDSPAWLKARLEAIGLRPINHVVDVTNFILHDLGQPLHAFDAAKVSGDLVVRRAEDGETFEALDGESYVLTAEDTVIADASGAVLALAGVMGGAHSGVTESTTEILLESAYFMPSPIRRTSRRLALSSDSSYRFERGVDPAMVEPAAATAARLMIDLAGSGALGGARRAGGPPAPPAAVELDGDRLDQLTGSSIGHDQAAAILRRLGLESADGKTWEVPSFRADLERHIDLVEEIVRVHGLARVPARLRATFAPGNDTDRAYDADMRLRHRLAGLGFHECQTIKLISRAQTADALPLKPLREGDRIEVSLPLSEDHAVMRPSLVPGLIASAERNLRQGATSLRLFELGKFFRNAGGGKAVDLEAESLALLLGGDRRPGGWDQAAETADLYDLKAVIQALVPHHPVRFAPRDRAPFALGADVLVGGQNLGSFAMVAPQRQRDLDAGAPIYVAELDLAKLRQYAAVPREIEPLPQFPGSTRDAAINAPIGLANAEIEKALAKIKEPLLTGYRCFDLFRDPEGEKLAADRKSLAYRLFYRAGDRTLKTKEVDRAHQGILDALAKALPIEFR